MSQATEPNQTFIYSPTDNARWIISERLEQGLNYSVQDLPPILQALAPAEDVFAAVVARAYRDGFAYNERARGVHGRQTYHTFTPHAVDVETKADALTIRNLHLFPTFSPTQKMIIKIAVLYHDMGVGDSKRKFGPYINWSQSDFVQERLALLGLQSPFDEMWAAHQAVERLLDEGVSPEIALNVASIIIATSYKKPAGPKENFIRAHAIDEAIVRAADVSSGLHLDFKGMMDETVRLFKELPLSTRKKLFTSLIDLIDTRTDYIEYAFNAMNYVKSDGSTATLDYSHAWRQKGLEKIALLKRLKEYLMMKKPIQDPELVHLKHLLKKTQHKLIHPAKKARRRI